jgi:hypothetical protein
MTEEKITADMFLPDVVGRYPATRAVLDRYGLKGCGGPTGPREQVAWFARLHGVPLPQLLQELNEAAQQPQPEGVAFQPSLADTIYRPFFVAGLTTVLSLGCLWGAINLLMIGLRRYFGGVDYSWTLAHGHAMVFGFVGFFIMGFAYQAFPRFKHTALWRPGLAFSALPLMAIGIGLQTVAHLIAPRSPFLPLGVGAGLIQLAAVAIFALVIAQTMKQAQKPEPYDSFPRASLGWFILAALANPVIFWLFESATTREQFLFRVATFNVPYRDVQLLGIAVVMIFGVSLRYLPHAYALREPSDKWRAFLLWGVNGSIAVAVASYLAGMLSGNYWLLAAQGVAALILLIAAAGTPRQFHLFGPVPESERDRGLKFVRAGYIWLIVAMVMLVLFPIYNFAIYQPMTAAKAPFSHAFFGAYRHALTVGLIMMMIVGVSSKVVPTLAGVDVRRAASLWPTFILLNFGNMLRISTEIATDFTPIAYTFMGVSGFFEVAGLALWGYELVKNMRAGAQLEQETVTLSIPSNEPFMLTPQMKVAEVLARYPQSLDVFLRHGFTPLSNPVLRRTMARVVTLEQACRREGVELDALMTDLRRVVMAEQGPFNWLQLAERRIPDEPELHIYC